MSDVLRVGLVGLGTVAQAVHLPLLARRNDLYRIAAVCDISPALRKHVGERYAVDEKQRYPDLEAMVGSVELDAVFILTPGSHGPAALQALESGLAVFCEKPLAYTCREADALQRVLERDPRPLLFLGYMKQYDPAVRQLATMLPPPEQVRSVEVTVLHPSAESQLAFLSTLQRPTDVAPEIIDALRAEEKAVVRQALGDVPSELARLYTDVVLGSIVHDLSVVRLLIGSPSRVTNAIVWPPDIFPPSVAVDAELPGGSRLHVRWHYLTDYPAYRETIAIHHTRGSLIVTFPSPYLLNAPSELEVVDWVGNYERRARYRSVSEEFEEELVAFHSMVTAGTPPLSSAREGKEDILTCQQILRAIARHRGVDLGGEAA